MVVRTARDLGALIRDRRRRIGFDQKRLAASLGVSRQWVIGVERGKARAELGLVLRALDALGVELTVAEAGDSDAYVLPAPADIDAIARNARKPRR
jgi:HTH-type transcriptional regulator/antitoxin HipB